ncbi:hypothetical protein CYLTODRAFT_424707 [Cylindrobasidium torrendii FP15055 ss-10]|uniref:PWI domain-containing protein n=1 Tax=Cylindrobasidium torrendii FP15055 ss-10 TaxID=1314674 RepID=A0A0D7B479_9AGAR|nr:hypothetical protein CYLTODRAFT_424707 [Cylindrobasidium torrendii FP15055 ss-10]
MQQPPNRMGIGLRPPFPSLGQGPSMSALAAQNQHNNYPPPQRVTTLFVGSISGGIEDSYLNRLLDACGPIQSFKRLITPANKPQGFGFADFADPDSALRAIELLNGVELPALEDGCANKKLLIKADEKTKTFLDAYSSQRMLTDVDEQKKQASRQKLKELVDEINQTSEDAANKGLIDREKYVIPPHLHDLQEADLPETQRGLVISEIAQFRERAAKREREKQREAIPGPNAPSGPKGRDWGRPPQGFGTGPQGYHKPPGFVQAAGAPAAATPTKTPAKQTKSDEELEQERQEARRRDEENSFRDRERRFEPRERTRITGLDRAVQRAQNNKEAEERDQAEMRARLDIWDDDESDELFYVDRARWRAQRARRLEAEEDADAKSRRFDEQEAENLRRESEDFLARQLDEMQSLQEEQRKAGMLLDDGAPLKLSVAMPTKDAEPKKEKKEKAVLMQDDDEDEVQTRKVPLVKLDVSLAESAEQLKERLANIKTQVPTEKDALFKHKVRWDGITDTMVDRKLEPLVKRLMVKYLGEMDEDDLIMFVVEHLKDHKGPLKLIEGLEPVLEEDAIDFVVALWRQIVFESMAYGEGLHTEKMMVSD